MTPDNMNSKNDFEDKENIGQSVHMEYKSQPTILSSPPLDKRLRENHLTTNHQTTKMRRFTPIAS